MSDQTIKLKVKVNGKTGISSFRRCGFAFTKEWQSVEVDEATAKRLQTEQMLEVKAENEQKPETKPNNPKK